MNKSLTSNRSGTASRIFAPTFHGNISRHIGNIRSVTLKGSAMNASRIFGIADAVQPETDKKFPRPKDNVIYAFGKTKGVMTTAAIVLIGLVTLSVPTYAANRNVESVLASQSDLSLFYQALLNTGVADELNPNIEYTIFAPTNAAFTAIQPRAYPCFYSAQCRIEVAAILRNHIVPRNESINAFSKWGGDIPTIGNRELYVEETYKDQYTVEGRIVLHQNQGDRVSLYPVDGVIASKEELAQFRTQPVADNVGTVTEKTITTYRTPVTHSAVSSSYAVPGGTPVTTSAVYNDPDELPDSSARTTTVTRTTTTE